MHTPEHEAGWAEKSESLICAKLYVKERYQLDPQLNNFNYYSLYIGQVFQQKGRTARYEPERQRQCTLCSERKEE